jgi:eukaryotic-like serine/threonine-protein kinase
MEQQLGNYHLTRLLGSGGFADVYYGEHLYLKTSAAIKVLHVQIARDEHEKFLAEARIAARLEHPHIISVLEFGIEHTTPYLVMDYAANGTMRQQYSKGTRLTIAQIMPVVEHVASALSYTHQQNLIHRDVKPENMLLNSKHDILLSDFGIALVVQNTQHLDAQQHVVGTIVYMAPEQLRGEPCPASDQYALGAVIYEWLCGEPPFSGSYTEVAIQHALVPPIPLRKRIPHFSSEIEEVIMIALAKEPLAHFKSIKAFANAFKQACTSEQYTEISERRDDASLKHDVLEDAEEAHSPKRHSRRTFAVGLSLLGGAGLIAGGTLAWKFLLQRSQTSQHAPTATKPGTTLYTYHGHEGEPVQALAWSNDSQRIASAGDNVQVWDAQTGKLDRIYHNGLYEGQNISTTKMAWSPDKRYIATARSLWIDKSNLAIYIWDVSTGKVAYKMPCSEVTALAWSPNSTSIASTDGKIIRVWNALTGSQVSSYTGHTAFINSLTWSPDGKWIASSDGDYYAEPPTGGTVHVWESATGQLRLIYHGHPDSVAAAAWSPNGQLIASAGGSYYGQASDPNNNTVQI